MRKKSRFPFLFLVLTAVLCLPWSSSLPVSAQVATAAAPQKAQAKDKYAKLDKWRIHYQSYGKGSDALVFVHGWSCNLTFWDENAPLITGVRRLITVDLIGHGKSDKPQVTYDMNLFARSVDAVLKDAGIKRAVLAGHSMGTPVVRQFYRNYPEKTLGLILVDGSLTQFGTPEQMAPLIAAFKGPNYKQAMEQFIGTLAQNVASKAILDHITTDMLATPQYVVVGGMEAMNDPAIFKPDPIKVPVLAIYSAAPYWTPEYFAELHKIVPDMQEQVWTGVSHFLMMDQPQKFNSAVTAFLTSKSMVK